MGGKYTGTEYCPMGNFNMPIKELNKFTGGGKGDSSWSSTIAIAPRCPNIFGLVLSRGANFLDSLMECCLGWIAMFPMPLETTMDAEFVQSVIGK